ncbi:hypothetical protein JCM8547_007743 [Rhodosporidiobolus lusitaniae]
MASSSTLAVLFAPESQHCAQRVQQQLVQDGFRIQHEATLSGEELEEAGLDLGLGTGEEDREDGKEDEMMHTVFVLSRQNAVERLKELKATSLAVTFHDLHIFAAPSVSAANMAIDTLFPSLPTSPQPQSPATVSFPAASSPTTSKPKPFALSNLAFVANTDVTPSSSSTSNRTLSPSIEKALEELEVREERRRKSSTDTRSSASTPRLASRASGFASTCAEDGQDEQEVSERRVFTAHSRSSSVALSATSALEKEAEEEQEPEERLENEFDGEELLPEDLQEKLEDTVDESSIISPSLLSAPGLSRVASNLSSTSTASNPSSSSFRARPAPASTAQAKLQPRLSKAAALRLGVSLAPTTPRCSVSNGSSSSEAVPPTVPRVVPTPKSLAPPSIAPRMTKSVSLRTAQDDASAKPSRPAPIGPRKSISTAERAAMDRAARRHSIAVTPSLPLVPAVEVRMSRAAMLRQGKDLPPTTPRLVRQSSTATSTSVATADDAEASSTISKRSSASANLKSLREPTFAPRPTLASARRTNSSGHVPSESPSMSRGRSLGTLEDLVAEQQHSGRVKVPVDFDGVPGHKRRESIQVKATQPPKVEVKMSRAARLRNGIVEEEPEKKTGKTDGTATFEGVPGHRRRETIAVASSKAPSITPRLNRAVLLRQTPDDSTAPPRASSSLNRRSASALASLTVPTTASSSSLRAPSPLSPNGVAKKPSPAVLTAAPKIAPRLNKSAELRAAKKAAEQATPSGPKRKVLPAGGKTVTTTSGATSSRSRPSTALGLALRETTNSPNRR